jgi:hypothetical protein
MLESIRKSRTRKSAAPSEQRFFWILDSASGQSDAIMARHHHVSRSTVVLCIQKFLPFGLEAASGNCPGLASRGSYRTTRLPGCRTALAKSRKNWAIPSVLSNK